MTTYLSVTPGIDMSRALGTQRLTKKWLREYLRDHPEKDFRNHTGRGAYVNGGNVYLDNVILQVMRDGTTVAMVTYQPTDTNDWGYQAVVR